MHANPLGVFLSLNLFLLSSHPFPNTLHLILEYGDGMFFRNFGIQPKYYAAQPRPQCNFPVYLAFQLVAFKEVFIRDYVWLFFHPCHASNASVSTASLIPLWGYYCQPPELWATQHSLSTTKNSQSLRDFGLWKLVRSQVARIPAQWVNI